MNIFSSYGVSNKHFTEDTNFPKQFSKTFERKPEFFNPIILVEISGQPRNLTLNFCTNPYFYTNKCFYQIRRNQFPLENNFYKLALPLRNSAVWHLAVTG